MIRTPAARLAGHTNSDSGGCNEGYGVIRIMYNPIRNRANSNRNAKQQRKIYLGGKQNWYPRSTQYKQTQHRTDDDALPILHYTNSM